MNTLPETYLQFAKSVTQAAAFACHSHVGRGDERSADQAAVTAMREALSSMPFTTHVVIGEGERDAAPMLYAGEVIGSGDEVVEIAVDPLEGTTLCANNMPDAISVLALASQGCLLAAPDVYMHKIAVGPSVPPNVVSLQKSLVQNIEDLAICLGKEVRDLTICMLNRDRHTEWVHEARAAGARVRLITDGDVMGALATSLGGDEVDMYYGIGGAPEGVLAAAGLSCLGGYMEGRLIVRDAQEMGRIEQMGIKDIGRVYSTDDMVRGDVIFCATGVTSGAILDGIEYDNGVRRSHHLLLHRSRSTIQFISEVAGV